MFCVGLEINESQLKAGNNQGEINQSLKIKGIKCN